MGSRKKREIKATGVKKFGPLPLIRQKGKSFNKGPHQSTRKDTATTLSLECRPNCVENSPPAKPALQPVNKQTRPKKRVFPFQKTPEKKNVQFVCKLHEVESIPVPEKGEDPLFDLENQVSGTPKLSKQRTAKCRQILKKPAEKIRKFLKKQELKDSSKMAQYDSSSEKDVSESEEEAKKENKEGLEVEQSREKTQEKLWLAQVERMKLKKSYHEALRQRVLMLEEYKRKHGEATHRIRTYAAKLATKEKEVQALKCVLSESE